MTKSVNLSPALAIIKEFEGLYLKAYRDPVGIPTIGYGTIRYPSGKRVQMGQTCSKKQAEEWLAWEINDVIIEPMTEAIKVKVTNNQACALISFCYNLGVGAFKKSTLLKRLNRKEPSARVGDEFNKWVYAGGKKLKGLVRRRKAERELFLRPEAAELMWL